MQTKKIMRLSCLVMIISLSVLGFGSLVNGYYDYCGDGVIRRSSSAETLSDCPGLGLITGPGTTHESSVNLGPNSYGYRDILDPSQQAIWRIIYDLEAEVDNLAGICYPYVTDYDGVTYEPGIERGVNADSINWTTYTNGSCDWGSKISINLGTNFGNRYDDLVETVTTANGTSSTGLDVPGCIEYIRNANHPVDVVGSNNIFWGDLRTSYIEECDDGNANNTDGCNNECIAIASCVDYPNIYTNDPSLGAGGGCDMGYYINTVDSESHWQWNCETAGGDVATCEARKPYCDGLWEAGEGSWLYCDGGANCQSDCTCPVGYISNGLGGCNEIVSESGECASYLGTYPTQPATNTPSGCTSGTYVNRTDTSTQWQWECQGAGGGNTVVCSALKQGVCSNDGNVTCNADVDCDFTAYECVNTWNGEEDGTACSDDSDCWVFSGEPRYYCDGDTIPRLCRNNNNNPFPQGAGSDEGCRLYDEWSCDFIPGNYYDQAVLDKFDQVYGLPQYFNPTITTNYCRANGECSLGVCVGVFANIVNPGYTCAGMCSGLDGSGELVFDQSVCEGLGHTRRNFCGGGANWSNQFSLDYTVGPLEYDYGSCRQENSTCEPVGGGGAGTCVMPGAGVCEVYDLSYEQQPAYDDVSGCISGTYNDTVDESGNWKWECIPTGGGQTATCSASVGACYELQYPSGQGSCDIGNEIILVMDTSGSMGGSRIQAMKDAISNVLSITQPGVASGDVIVGGSFIGAITFDSNAEALVVPPTNDFAALDAAVQGISHGGMTNIGDAILLAGDILEDGYTSNPQHIILISDGYPNTGPNSVSASNQVQANGVTVHTIGLQTSADALLTDIASTIDNFYDADSSSDLEYIYANIFGDISCFYSPPVFVNTCNSDTCDYIEVNNVTRSAGGYTIDSVTCYGGSDNGSSLSLVITDSSGDVVQNIPSNGATGQGLSYTFNNISISGSDTYTLSCQVGGVTSPYCGYTLEPYCGDGVVDGSGGCTTIDATSFEGDMGIWIDPGPNASLSNQNPRTDRFSYRIAGNTTTSAIVTTPFDGRSYPSLTLNFWVYSESIEAGDDLTVDVSLDQGVSWTEVQRFKVGSDLVNNSSTNHVVNYAGTMASKMAFKIQSRTSSTSSDAFYLDDVSLGSCTAGGDGEECDDGNTNNNDSCTNECTFFECEDPGTISFEGTVTCPDDDRGLTSSVNYSVTNTCTSGTKCELICDDGYVFDAGECIPENHTYTCGSNGTWTTPPAYNTCITPDTLTGQYEPGDTVCAGSTPNNSYCGGYQCQGGPLENASLCTVDPNEGSPNNGATDYVYIASCSSQSSGIKCEYTCNAGFFRNGAKCESTELYVCQLDGTWTNSGNGAVTGESFGPRDTWRPNQGNASTIVLFESVTPPTNNQCVPRTCQGTLPGNATLCGSDETSLIENGTISYTNLASCSSDTATKCEYACNSGYQFVDTGTQGDGIGICEQEYNRYECDGQTGTWNLLPTKCGASEANTPNNPASPGTIVCALTQPVTTCQERVCGGSVPANATQCGNNTDLPDGNQSYAYISDCDALAGQPRGTETYCNFECNSGYESDGAGGCRMKFNTYECQLNGNRGLQSSYSCTQSQALSTGYVPGDTVCRPTIPENSRCDAYECQTPPDLPTDPAIYTLCGADEELEVPSDDVSYTNISSCSLDSGAKCEFACADNYVWNGTTCIEEFTTYECLITGDWSAGTTNDCHQVDYQSANSYSPGSVVCIDPSVGPTPPPNTLCDTNRCTGTIPTNATVCPTDDQSLNTNVAISVVAGVNDCSSPAQSIKCERYCHAGYTFDGTNCVADYVEYTCDTSGSWINNGPGCPSYSYNSGGQYTPGDTVCTDTTPSDTECVVCQDNELDVGEECDDGNANDNDSCIVDIEAGERVCKSAFCGDGYVYGAQFGGSEECDGQVGCTSCTWDAVDCSLSASSSTINIGEDVTFTYSATGPSGVIITPLNFGDNNDAPVSGSSTVHSFASPGVYTASFAVINPGIQTTIEPLASRVKKVCSVQVTVQGGACGNNQLDTGEECEIIDGEITACSGGGICNPYVCACQNTCDEVIRTLQEECDYGTKCSDFSTCSTNADCAGIGDGLCTVRSGDGCSDSCNLEVCGDGIFQPLVGVGNGQVYYEECEYTGPEANPNCTNACVFASCGDGIVQQNRGEMCDAGKICFDGADQPVLDGSGNPIRCETNTQICAGGTSYCRTNTLDIECDSSCRLNDFCGDGNINYGDDGVPNTADDVELCDDGSSNSADDFCWSRSDAIAQGNPNLACTITRCGDGYVQADGNGATGQPEQCDDGNSIDDDACSNLCRNNDAQVGECQDSTFLADLDSQSIIDGVYNNLDNYLCAQGSITQDSLVFASGSLTWICDVPGGTSTTQAFCSMPTCGDGVLDIGETCDNGRHCTDNPTQSCSDDSDCGSGVCEAVAGDGCNEVCQQEAIFVPVGNDTTGGATCVEAGAYPIVHDDEYLPFWRQGDQADNIIHGYNQCTQATDGKVLADTAMCYFGVARYEGLVEVARAGGDMNIFKQPCFDITPGIESNNPLQNKLLVNDALEDFGAVELLYENGEVVTVQPNGLLGASYFVPSDPSQSLTYRTPQGVITLPTTDEIISVNQPGRVGEKLYGQYEIRLLGIEYEYCSREKTIVQTTVTTVCEPDAPGAQDPDNDGIFTCEVTRQEPGPITDILSIPMYFDMSQQGGLTMREPQFTPFYTSESQEICRVPFTISKPYFIQRGSTFQEVANSTLSEIYNIDGTVLNTSNTIIDPNNTNAGRMATLDSQARSGDGSQSDNESAYTYLLNTFNENYERLAIVESTVAGGAGMNLINNTKKTPNQNIFYYYGAQDVPSSDIRYLLDYYGVCQSGEPQEECDPFTLVFKREDPLLSSANLDVQGNLNYNAMYLIEGQIHFATDRNTCDDAFDVVDGILVAKSGFTAEKLRNDSLETQWCMRGGLQIRGLMFGSGINQELFDMRRSALSSWSDSIFDGNPVQAASELFNTCYMPTLVMRHLLESAGTQPELFVKANTIPQFNGQPLFVAGPNGTAAFNTQNTGPVSIPAFKYAEGEGDTTAGTWIQEQYIDEETGQPYPVKYCNIDTYRAYKPMIDAMRIKLVDRIYQTCMGNGDFIQNQGSYGYCGDGIVQEGEACDNGDNPQLGFDFYCSASRCAGVNELTPREQGNTVEIPFGVRRYIEASGLVVDSSTSFNPNLLNERIEDWASEQGTPIECYSAGNANVPDNRLTRRMITKIVNDRFNIVREGFEPGVTIIGFTNPSTTLGKLFNTTFGYGFSYGAFVSSKGASINNYDGSTGIGNPYIDGLRQRNSLFAETTTDMINISLKDGSSFGVSNNSSIWLSLPPGGTDFIDFIQSTKDQ